MIQINKQGNAIVIEFTDNDKYLFNGTIEIAPNELMVVVDDSNMATFKRVSNGDTLFSQIVDKIQINGTTASKDTVIDLFGSIGYSSGGGGGTGAVSSVNGQTGDVVITAAGIGAITKNQADNIYQVKGDYALKSDIPSTEDLATKEELNEKQEVFQVNAPMAFERDEATQDLHLSINLGDYAKKTDLNSKADSSTVEALSTEIATVSTNVSNLTSKVNEDSDKIASLDTEMGNKQDTLVSGTNIKTINNQSILGEGNIEIQGGSTITVDSELSDTSVNPVQNKVINSALGTKANSDNVYTKTEVNTKLDGKVDKVEGKSLVSDTEITKLAGLKSQTEIDNSIADAKKAGTDALTNLTNHINDTENPHQVTATQIGLGNVNNTSDADKPISTATLTALNTKVDKVEGKGLSTNDYTTNDKNKLAGIEAGAQVNTVTGVKGSSETSYRVGNINITKDNIGLSNVDNTSDANKPISTAVLNALNNKANSSDLEAKQDTLVSGTNIKTINGNSVLGSGNIEIQGGGSEAKQVYYAKYGEELTAEQIASNKAIYDDIKAGNNPSLYIIRNDTNEYYNIVAFELDGSYLYLKADYINANLADDGTYNTLSRNFLVIYMLDEGNAKDYGSTYKLGATTSYFKILKKGYLKIDTSSELNAKQTNIADATAVGQGLADSYDVKQYIASHGSGVTVDTALSTESENPVQNKIITAALNGKQAAGDYALKSEIPDVSGLATKTELNTISSEIEHKADKTSVYTMDEVNTKLATKQATLVAGTNITLSDPDAEGKVTISADISGITTTVEELTGEVAALSTDKQDKLVSGTNIKTINGETILGTGDITMGTVDTAMSDTSENAVQNKVIKAYIDSLVGEILTRLQNINGNN